jgi:hypothetical protein
MAVGKSRNFIAVLLNESIIARRFSGPADPDQRLLQLQQCCQINTRFTHSHVCTRDGIEHPTGDADDDPYRPLNLHKLAGRSLLHPPNKHLASKIGMPPVVDFKLSTDMGRMNG